MSKEHVLEVAYNMAQHDGFCSLSRRRIATKAGVATGTVSFYWGNMQALRDALMERAVKEENVDVILDGLAVGNSVAKNAPKELRQKALASMM